MRPRFGEDPLDDVLRSLVPRHSGDPLLSLHTEAHAHTIWNISDPGSARFLPHDGAAKSPRRAGNACSSANLLIAGIRVSVDVWCEPLDHQNRGPRPANCRSDVRMATVQESIEVDVPLSQAYNQWTQFEDFPHFMSGIDSVTQLDESTVHFKTSIGGVKRQYDARITAQEPDQLVSWAALDEPRNSGIVRFEPGSTGGTRVSVELSWHPETAAEKLGAAVGLDSRQVASDLKKFKTFIEERGAATGAWRGTVESGGRVAGPAPARRVPLAAPSVPTPRRRCRWRRKWTTVKCRPSSTSTPTPTSRRSRRSGRKATAERANTERENTERASTEPGNAEQAALSRQSLSD